MEAFLFLVLSPIIAPISFVAGATIQKTLTKI